MNRGGYPPSGKDETMKECEGEMRSICGSLNEASVECLARLYSSLSDPTRIRILQALCCSESIGVGPLADELGLSISAVSHQLGLLRDRRLVSAKRYGRNVEYSLLDDHIRMLLEIGLEHVAEDC